jgi:pimeloyl-ACP methyl ester carboxylesterase
VRRLSLVLCAGVLALAATDAGATAAGAVPAPREAVVLLHGLFRSDRSMRPLARHLVGAGFEVHNVRYESLSRNPEDLVEDLHRAVSACCAAAPRVDFVGHSLGGVLVRAYLAEHPLPQLGRVVMLAPPNRGSELGDVVAGSRPLRALLGPTAAQLGTDPASLPNRLPPPDFEIGVVAGTRSWNPLGSWLLPERDDGTVSLASTRCLGMTDFLALPVSHTFIVRSREVARQVAHFLRTGRFAGREARG